MPDYNKFKSAVIHIECAGQNKAFYEQLRELNEEARETKMPDSERMERKAVFNELNDRFYGTAVFIKYNGKRYLLTAYHVVFDELGSDVDNIFEHLHGHMDIRIPQPTDEDYEPEFPDGGSMYAIMRDCEYDSNKDIFNYIFRVPSIDDYHLGKANADRRFLMNIFRDYFELDKQNDLAVISLDSRYTEFADQLEWFGHSPISLDDFHLERIEEGQDIFTVGYPSAVADISDLKLPAEAVGWASNLVSAPAFSFGKVGMSSQYLPYYWIDINVSSGNSGGPIIWNDKLVAILSTQARTQVEATYDLDEDNQEISDRFSVGIPYAKAVWGNPLVEIIERQYQKDIGQGIR